MKKKELEMIDLELRGLRYLINTLTLQMFDLRSKLEDMQPSTKTYKLPTPNNTGDSVRFDMFSLAKDKYTKLCDKFGVDIVGRACSRLDLFIKDYDHIPYRLPHLALERKFIKEVLIEEREALLARTVKAKEFEEIDNEEDAVIYINSIPPHLRDLSEEVKELRERYSLE